MYFIQGCLLMQFMGQHPPSSHSFGLCDLHGFQSHVSSWAWLLWTHPMWCPHTPTPIPHTVFCEFSINPFQIRAATYTVTHLNARLLTSFQKNHEVSATRYLSPKAAESQPSVSHYTEPAGPDYLHQPIII